MLLCGWLAGFPSTQLFAQQRVGLILTPGTLVTMDATRRVLQDGAIAVQGDTIVAIDSSQKIEAMYGSGKVIDARGALILPGLINAHTHMSMSLFRGPGR